MQSEHHAVPKEVWNAAKRWLAAALGCTLALSGLVGFAHTVAGRPLLNALRGAPGCPVDLDGADPVGVEQFRVRSLEARRGHARELSRPALGFELGRTTREQVLAVLSQRGADCHAVRSGSVLRCTTFAESSLAPKIEDLHIQFDPAGHLVALDLFRQGKTSTEALAWLSAREEELSQSVGAPTSSRGVRSAEDLARGPLRRFGLEYRYLGYDAALSVTNFGARGFKIREQYQFVPEHPG